MNPYEILMILATWRNMPRADRLKISKEAFECVIAEDRPRHFIISGRIPGDDEDSTAHVAATAPEEAEYSFIFEELYGGDMPDGWRDRDPTHKENCHGEWAYVQSVIEILGPPL